MRSEYNGTILMKLRRWSSLQSLRRFLCFLALCHDPGNKLVVEAVKGRKRLKHSFCAM